MAHKRAPNSPDRPPEPDLPVFKPYLGSEVHSAVTTALDVGWLGMGPSTARFEGAIGSYLGTDRPVVATGSGTTALHCALTAAGVGPGDEVICPSFTYVAGHQAITATGADVVFCDIEERTLGLDARAIDALVGERTKAIMLVHYAGLVADVDGVYEVARRHGLRVVEDAAHAFGSEHGGKMIGSFGDLICFSFGPVKIITCLEGGAVVAPDEADVQTLHELRMIGVDRDTEARYRMGRAWDYDVVRQGFRYHLGSIPAAIGLSQLEMIATFIDNRRRYCRYYNEQLATLDQVTVPQTDYRDESPFIYFVRVADGETRDQLMRHLGELGIGSGIHFLGAHHFTMYQSCRRGSLDVTERVSDQQLTLPLHSFMEQPDLDRVVAGIRTFFA